MNWRGEFTFGQAWVAFRGHCGDNGYHRHATAQVTIGIDGPVTIRQPGSSSVTGSALFVRPGVSHALDPTDSALLILVEPQTLIGRKLIALSESSDVSVLPRFARELIDARGVLSRCLDKFHHENAHSEPLDERLDAALIFIESAQGARVIERAAALVQLSSSRLRALAQRYLGISLAKWVMLRKLHHAARALSSGCSLAEAAADAGFSDQAHLTRSMRQVFGVTPSTAASMISPAQAKPSRDRK